MSVFANYARYYDLLYRDKDYAAEVDFVAGLMSRNGVSTGSLLELGCGTGRHAGLLATKGYSVDGVDLSSDMVAQAQTRLDGLPSDVGRRLKFLQGDVRSVRLGQVHDAVISLFHVASYQTTNAELMAMFDTAAAHLETGGVFVFDCWYGPAVLTDRPAVRIRRLSDDQFDVLRIAEPVMYPNDNVVDVNYTVLMTDRRTGEVETTKETHRMRYLFVPELVLMLGSTGFDLVECLQWMGGGLGFGSWAATFVARAR